MRNMLVVVMAVVGLLAAPSLGVVNIKLVADQTTLAPGETTTIRILAEGVGAAVYSIGGQIDATGTAGCLTANAGSFAWVPEMDPTPAGFLLPRLGLPGSNGGWNLFGSVQTYAGMDSDPTFGNGSFVEVASYTVTCQSSGQVTLTFSPKSVGGYKMLDMGFGGMGTATAVTITVPEPVSLALLALGGLLALRRRFA